MTVEIEDEDWLTRIRVWVWSNIKKIRKKDLIKIIDRAEEENKRLRVERDARKYKMERAIYKQKWCEKELKNLQDSLVDEKRKEELKERFSENRAQKEFCEWCKPMLEIELEEKNRPRQVIVDECLREIDEELKGNPEEIPDSWVCKKPTTREPREAEKANP